MIIRFVDKHLSIEDFPPTEIADFTVLTGLNGAGKSHLLAAIEKRFVAIDGINQNQIVRFSHDNFRIEGETEFLGSQIQNEAQQLWNFCQQNIQPMSVNWTNSLPGGDSRINEPEMYQIYLNQIQQFVDGNQNLKQQMNLSALLRTLRFLRVPLHQIDRDLFIQSYRPIDARPDSLPSALGKVCLEYHRRRLDNYVIKVQNDELGENRRFLDRGEFIALHGEAPWKIINEILSRFNSVQYRVTNPERLGYDQGFRLRLVSVNDPSLIINFEELSSGEKILMALVALVYKQTTSGSFPDLVLLDEIDASLHPSMTQNMLSVLQTVFVERGTRVIMVTHSPSTIALVPEESIFVVNRAGPNKLEKRTRSDALSILTEGFATLEEGLVVFDRTNLADVSIISEGYNTIYIKEALKHAQFENVQVVENLEGMSGKNSLHTLFEFFCRVKHRAKVIFVWDCDANEMRRLKASEDTIPFVFAKNSENTFIAGGIENLLPMALCEEFAEVSIVKSRFKNMEKKRFDGDKLGLANTVKERNDSSDLAKFEPLMALIRSLKVPIATTPT